MEERLHLVTKDTVVIIDAMALIIVAIGTAEAFFIGLRVAFPAPAANRRLHEVLAALRTLARRWPHFPARSRHHRDVDCAKLAGGRAVRRYRGDTNRPELLPRARSDRASRPGRRTAPGWSGQNWW
jgi:hypothetical protein